MTVKKFKAGDVIFQKGDASETAYVVNKGVVLIKGRDVRELDEGSLFGDEDMVETVPRTEEAVAKTNLILREITRDEFADLFNKTPEEMQKLITNFVESNRKIKTGTPDKPSSPKSSLSNSSPEKQEFVSSVDKITDLLSERCLQLEKQMKSFAGIEDDEDVEEIEQDEYDEKDLREKLISEIQYGSIAPLLEDDSVNDILINGHNQVYVERDTGRLELTNAVYPNDRAVLDLAEQIVHAVGRKLRKNRPVVDARLPDGSRVNIIAPPLSVDGTSISIRKFSKKLITLDDMKESRNISNRIGEFLKIVAKCRMNTIISGGTGSGKTTLLNAMSQHISEKERIVTIEDAAELKLGQPHVVRLETKPVSGGARKQDEVTIRDLVINALRMRPDRIVVGEVRGPEAFDMMQAMNTGHEGSLTTIHANHPRDALSRLENMIGMANLHIPELSIRQQITSAIHLIIQTSRMRDGKRRVTNISEIIGIEGSIITLQELFSFVSEGEDGNGNLVGKFKWSGIMPRFLRRVAYYGEQEKMEEVLGIKLPKVENTKVKGMK